MSLSAKEPHKYCVTGIAMSIVFLSKSRFDRLAWNQMTSKAEGSRSGYAPTVQCLRVPLGCRQLSRIATEHLHVRTGTVHVFSMSSQGKKNDVLQYSTKRLSLVR